jgi:hypothetical protein
VDESTRRAVMQIFPHGGGGVVMTGTSRAIATVQKLVMKSKTRPADSHHIDV